MQRKNKDPLDALLDFIIADHGQTGAIFHDAGDMQAAQISFVSICVTVDARGWPLAGSKSHPRGWVRIRESGRYVRDEKLMRLN
jgi:hypothetical protein